MERLSGMDAFFLYLETPTQHMHVTLCAELAAPAGDDPVSFARIRDHIAGRVHLIPPFTRRLVPVPLQVHHPLWAEDPDFDIDHHVRRAALPPPGGDAELAALTAQIAGQPLDRSRPLWEMWVLEGLAHGGFALVAKLHHSTLDGVAGVEQMVNLFDLEPTGRVIEPPAPTPPDEIPSDLELVAFAAVSKAISVLDAVPLVGRTAGSVWAVRRRRSGTDRATADPEARARAEAEAPSPDPLASAHLLGDGGRDPAASHGPATDAAPAAGGTPLAAPRTPLNGTIGASRRVGFARLPLPAVKQIKAAVPGATVNDVVLTVVAGALRTYLRGRGALPDDPLVAACPVNVRAEHQKGRADNRVSALFALLHTELADPLARLAATHRTSQAAKHEHALFGPDTLQQWAEVADPNLFSRISALYASSGFADRHRPAVNVMVSNVPGPPVPLYLAGSRLVRAYPMGQIIEGIGLNITVMSYCDSIDFGFMAAANLLPDLDALSAAVEPAFIELADAAGLVVGA